MTSTVLKVKMDKFPQIKSTQMDAFFKKQHQLKLAKYQAKAKQRPVTEFCYLKIIRFFHPRYH